MMEIGGAAAAASVASFLLDLPQEQGPSLQQQQQQQQQDAPQARSSFHSWIPERQLWFLVEACAFTLNLRLLLTQLHKAFSSSLHSRQSYCCRRADSQTEIPDSLNLFVRAIVWVAAHASARATT